MYTSNQMPDTEEVNLIIMAVELEDAEKLIFSLEEGYRLISVNAAHISDDEIDVVDGRIYELQKDENPILSFRTKGEPVHIESEQMQSSKYRKTLSKFFTQYIQEHEDPETAARILKQFNREPVNIPPWERTEPVRTLTTENFQEASLTLNEESNATRFEIECKPYLIYDTDKGCWYAWVINHWEEAKDRVWYAARFVSGTIREEYEMWKKEFEKLNALVENNPDTTAAAAVKRQRDELKQFVHALKNHVNSSKSDRGMRAMLNICGNSTMSVDLEKKTNVDLLTFKNGILDTKKGKLYTNAEAERFKPEYPTRYVDCTYIKGAIPEAFNDHLIKVFTDNTTPDLSDAERTAHRVEVGRYFLRWLGYMLIAGNPEQIMVFFYGVGANGKSTTIDIIRDILGEEIAEASIKELYATSEDKPATGISEGLARRGLLFSEASDSDEKTYGGKISRDSIKALTGEIHTARFRKMRHGGVRQKVNCKPFAVTNEMPHFDKEVDEALLRRIITILFPHRFTKSERDSEIYHKLQQERDAIFSLMVDECIAYRNGETGREGMKEPGLMSVPEFCKITQADLLAGVQYSAFIDSMYEKTDGKRIEDRTFRKEINECFMNWCDLNEIECSTVEKPVAGIDVYGKQLKARCLTRNELNHLYKAFKVKGFYEGSTCGNRYVCCRIRPKRTNAITQL